MRTYINKSIRISVKTTVTHQHNADTLFFSLLNDHKLFYSIIIDALHNNIHYTANDSRFMERNFVGVTDYSCVFASFIMLQSIQSRWFCPSRSCSKFFRRVVAFRCARSILDFKKQQELFRFTSRVIRARHAIYISNTSCRI